ncbi:MAG: cobalamin B12-binding domain-containing protein [Thermodesulfobacteriota bacterium]
MADLEALKEAVIKGKRNDVVSLVKQALDGGADPQMLINDYMIEALKVVGQRFEQKKIFVPEMMIAARAMQAGVDVIKPALESAGGGQTLGTVVMGTVFGDLHDIGKNLVCLMLESSGFKVVNIGENVPAEKFVAAAKEHNADVVGLSSLLTTGDPYVKSTVAALKESELGGKVKIMCGGAALTPKYVLDECKADGYAPDAVAAVRMAKDLMGIQ